MSSTSASSPACAATTLFFQMTASATSCCFVPKQETRFAASSVVRCAGVEREGMPVRCDPGRAMPGREERVAKVTLGAGVLRVLPDVPGRVGDGLRGREVEVELGEGVEGERDPARHCEDHCQPAHPCQELPPAHPAPQVAQGAREPQPPDLQERLHLRRAHRLRPPASPSMAAAVAALPREQSGALRRSSCCPACRTLQARVPCSRDALRPRAGSAGCLREVRTLPTSLPERKGPRRRGPTHRHGGRFTRRARRAYTDALRST